METLVTFVAPPDCCAIVAVGHGWAKRLEEDLPDSLGWLQPGERRRCRVVCLMTRDGDLAGYLREGSVVIIDEPPTVGRVPDCLRRCFSLATAPPEEGTGRLLAHLWLGNVLAAGEQASDRLTWSEVAGLHPAMQVAAEAKLHIPLAQLATALRVVPDAWTWSYLLEHAAEPGWLSEVLPDGAATWMDEGILARWLIRTFCDSGDLLKRATSYLTPAASKKLRRTLSQLGVLKPRHPVPWSVTYS